MKQKKTYLFLLSLLLTSLFSLNAWAAVPAPGEALSNLATFFTGLVKGGAAMENAYFISFILYFILFLAIFLEGLRVIPIFGAAGELNKQGKVFGVAAAALATLALFMIEQSTGVKTTERIEWLIAPWGIWGGVALAGIVALITYKMIKDSDLFKEETLMAMAITAAVGVTFAGFLLGLENLLGWGFLIMLIVFIVGAIKAVLSKREETAEERTARGEEKKEKLKKAVEYEERKRLLKPVKGFIIKAEEAAEDLKNKELKRKTDTAVKSAEAKVKGIRNNLIRAGKLLRAIKRKEKGEEREYFQRLYNYTETVLKHLEDNVKGKIPEVTFSDAEWPKAVASIKTAANAIQGYCGYVIKSIDDFIEEEKKELTPP